MAIFRGKTSEVEFLREQLVAERAAHRLELAGKDATISKLADRIASLADPIGQSRVDQVRALTERAIGRPPEDAQAAPGPRLASKTHNARMLARQRPDRPSEAEFLTFPDDPAQPSESNA